MPPVRRKLQEVPGRGANGAHHDSTATPVAVKLEPAESDVSPMTNSRQLLRQNIMAKRAANGLEAIRICFDEMPQNHELTPEEVMKKERRKEQNRRAARKCRTKKKLLQGLVATDYSKMQEANESMAAEVERLRKEKASLERIIAAHVQSGTCKNVKVESSACVVPTSPATMTSVDSSSLATGSTPPPVQEQLTLADPADINMYLETFGQLEPAETFELVQTLSQLVEIGDLTNIDSVDPALLPPGNDALSRVTASPVDQLKTIMPKSPSAYNMALLSPISPAADRNSVSSVTSDWSTCYSDQSQGFGVVPTGAGSPTLGVSCCRNATGGNISGSEYYSASLGSSSFSNRQGLMSNVSYGVGEGEDMDDEDDDDVFLSTATVCDENYFQQWRH